MSSPNEYPDPHIDGSAKTDVTLMLFTRAPVPGQVKTRLIPLVGAERACQLHQLMTSCIVSTACQSGVGHLQLWCTPTTSHSFFTQLARQFPLSLQLQQGSDLGSRMLNAFNQAFSHSHIIIVIGSDCLQIQSSHLEEVIRRLTGGDDVVLVPAMDGGYVLMGARRVDASLFSDIEWGSGSVLDNTRQRLDQLQWRYSELPAQYDIDEPEDLSRLIENVNDYEIDEPLKQFLKSLESISFS